MKTRWFGLFLLVALVVGCGVQASPGRAPFPTPPPGEGGSEPLPGRTPTAPPQAAADQGTFFVDTRRPTSGAQVAVDAAGGVHLVYAGYGATGQAPAFYAYCPSRCAEGAAGRSWGSMPGRMRLILSNSPSRGRAIPGC